MKLRRAGVGVLLVGGCAGVQLAAYRTVAGTALAPTPGTFSSQTVENRPVPQFRASPTGVDRTGFHTLSVKVHRTGMTVKARRGYFAG
jgi:hypothetical protein